MRWELASWLLAVNDHDGLKDLLDAYDDDASSVWPYTRTLLAFREGKEEARSALKKAWEWNPHVPDLILGAQRVPKRLPEEYRLRSREEAYLYVADNRDIWMKTPGAVEEDLADLQAALAVRARIDAGTGELVTLSALAWTTSLPAETLGGRGKMGLDRELGDQSPGDPCIHAGMTATSG